ncbi:MAG: hypothetical protein ACKVWR_07700 [Acidimicrobiales bacterium]
MADRSRPAGVRATAVLAELARRGVETNREALAALSDELGLHTRPATPQGGLGNRRWQAQHLDVLCAAFVLRDRYALPVDTISGLAHGRVRPEEAMKPFADALARLCGAHAA